MTRPAQCPPPPRPAPRGGPPPPPLPTSLIGRLIEPAEIANLCAYLASDQASATTGGAIRVDGGFVDNIVL